MASKERLLSLLQQYWGYRTFRPGQEEIIAGVLSGSDTLAILPTGGGKSLCYQLPALALDGVAIVVSPLIALMQDQAEGLAARGIPAAVFSGALDRSTIQQLLWRAMEGAFKLIYVSPERLQSRAFLQALPNIPVSFVAVDEAHCVSQWGHDFRAQYLDIKDIRYIHRRAPFLALTASATATVSADISAQLSLRNPVLIRQGIRRPALSYHTFYAENKATSLHAALPQQDAPGSAILYARTRRLTEEWTKSLNTAGAPAVGYHAGLSTERREKAQAEWMEGKAPMMVATSAFGMGIDKPDVRLVLHSEPPDSLEAYYQEAGRAGRDGAAASATLFYNGGDIRRLKSLPHFQYPPEEYLRSVYGAMMEYLGIPAGTEPDRSFPFDLAEFCNRFGLKPAAVQPALRLLEHEGLWSISDSVFHPATVWFTTGREDIDDIVARYPGPGVVAVALLRLYTGLLSYPGAVRISTVARYLRVKAAAVEAALNQLQQLGILRYVPQPDGPRIYVHHYRVLADHLQLDRERLLRLRASAQQRVDAMIAYLQDTTTCRTVLLERYFSEKEGHACGICDNCRKRGAPPEDKKGLRDTVLEVLAAAPQTPAALMSRLPHVEKTAIAQVTRVMLDEGLIRLSAGLLTV